MFGIGAGELMLIVIVLLIAVGPDKMPTFVKAVGRGIREFRKTTRDLRSSVGIDEIMRDETFRDPLGVRGSAARKIRPEKGAASMVAGTVSAGTPAGGASTGALGEEAMRVEQPPEGVDVTWAESRLRQERARGDAPKHDADAGDEASEVKP